MEIQTKRFLARQTITILKSSLRVEKKSFFDYSEYEIPLEDIHNKKKTEIKTNDNLLVPSFASLIFGLISLIASDSNLNLVFFITGAILFAIAMITRIKTIIIQTYTGEDLRLYFNNNNKEDVQDFSNKIIEASNSFLMKKYAKIDRLLPVDEQLHKIDFLRRRDIITEEEYENLKDQLLGRENRSTLGFNK